MSALLIVGFASAALANESVENRIGNNYPLLEEIVQPFTLADSAFADARRPVKSYTAEEKASFNREAATHGQY
jgi:hypothetical protein